MKTSSLFIGLAIWGFAYLLLNFQFSNGPIDWSLLGAYILFAPLLIAMVLVLTACGAIFATEAVRLGQR